MKFDYPGIDVRVAGNDRTLSLEIRVPEGSSASFAGLTLKVRTGEASFEVPVSEYTYYDRENKRSISVPALGVLLGKNEEFAFGAVQPRIFGAIVELPPTVGNTYTVTLPALLVNGVRHELPPIQFKKETGGGIYPINC